MSLFTECHRWSERAILALDDNTRGRIEEMQLQAALGVTLMFMRGGSNAVHMALSRSLAIAEEYCDVPTQAGLLSALAAFHNREAEHKTALRYAQRSQALTATVEAPATIAFIGGVLYIMGKLTDARTAVEASLRHRPLIQPPGTPHTYHPGSSAVILAHTIHSESSASLVLAHILWVQGHPSQAVERAGQLIKAAGVDRPRSRALLLSWSAWVFIWAGDFNSAERNIDSSISLSESYSLTPYVALGRSFKGALAIRRGDAKAGVEIIRTCLETLRSRYKQANTILNPALAEGLGKLGQPNDGVALVEETIRSVQENEEFVFMPELLRVKGGLFLSMPDPNSDAAEASFTQSLELSRQQGARSWELRTSIDLAGLWAKRGKPKDGRRLLLPIFDQFTEGQDTADLQAAARLLAELGEADWKRG
jgi:hypothetical protein